MLIIDNVGEIGNYSIKNSKSEFVATFSLNHSSEESIADFYTSDETKEILTKKFPNSKIQVIDNYIDFDLDKMRASLGTELWQIFLILALLCGLAELFVQKAYKNELE